jgi:clan AA aspartic protease
MVTGTVNAFREAVLRLAVCGPSGDERAVEAVVDTGYDGSLTLPPRLVAELRLPFRNRASALLGDGSRTVYDVHDGIVLWNGRLRRIAVDVVDIDPLLGMALLYGQELTIQVVEGGAVSVREMFQS